MAGPVKLPLRGSRPDNVRHNILIHLCIGVVYINIGVDFVCIGVVLVFLYVNNIT